MEGSPESAFIDAKGGKGATWLLGEGGPLFSQPGAGLGLLRNFPREGPTALLSPWGGNGTGHTSHRKLTSKERLREEHWLVPFLGLMFRAAPVPSAAYIFLHGSGGHCVTLPVMPRATRSFQILGYVDFLLLPKCI